MVRFLFTACTLIHALSTLPPHQELVLSPMLAEGNVDGLRYLGLVKCLRLLRMGRILRYLENFQFANAWRLVRLVAFFLTCVHWVACFWHFIGDLGGADSWVPPPPAAAATALRVHALSVACVGAVVGVARSWRGKACSARRSGQSTAHQRMLLWQCWSERTWTPLARWNERTYPPPSGRGRPPDRVQPYTLLNHCGVHGRYATVVIFYGACMNATLFGQVALLLQNQNSVYHRFQQELDSVNQNMRILNLPEELQQRVRNYYDYWFHRHRLLDYRKFVSQLSSALGSEVCLYLHREMVQKVPLFRHCSADFLVALVKTLSHRVYMPGDFIVRYGEVSHHCGTAALRQCRWHCSLADAGCVCTQFGFEMYFINSGECDIIAKNGCATAFVPRRPPCCSTAPHSVCGCPHGAGCL